MEHQTRQRMVSASRFATPDGMQLRNSIIITFLASNNEVEIQSCGSKNEDGHSFANKNSKSIMWFQTSDGLG